MGGRPVVDVLCEDGACGRAAIGAPGDTVLLGVVSDTHIPEARAALWPEVLDAFVGVDAILHGGDLHELSVLHALAEVAPVYAARGNGEDGSGGRPVTPDDPRLRPSWLLDVAGMRVGLTHDLPVPEIPPHLTVARWCDRRFGTTDVDLVVHGHTHVESIDLIGTTLCVNPGSPTYPRNARTSLGTVALLDVAPGRVRARLVQLTPDGPVPVASTAPVEHEPARR
jgi:hypothetical protein